MNQLGCCTNLVDQHLCIAAKRIQLMLRCNLLECLDNPFQVQIHMLADLGWWKLLVPALFAASQEEPLG
jgi:hypothetical protein